MTQPKRMILVLAVTASLTTGFATAAGSTPTVLTSCGTVSISGKKWQVVAAAFSCANAKTLVRKFAPKVPRSGVAHVGDYMGLRCTGFAQKGKRLIQCASTSGKLVEAQLKP